MLFTHDAKTAERVVEFFTAQIRNPNTRKAYMHATGAFAAWCVESGIDELSQVRPVHVAAYIEGLRSKIAAPSVKLQLAAIRMFFDWLVVGQVIPTNPAHSVKGPKHVIKKGKTSVLSAEEARAMIDSIGEDSALSLRDRALVGIMVYTFARVGAVIKMLVQDVYTQSRRTWVRLHEKGGKRHEMPCHHNLEEYIEAYLERTGIAADAKGYLFRTAPGHIDQLSDRPMTQPDVYRNAPPTCRIRRDTNENLLPQLSRDRDHRILKERRQARSGTKQMANHESARTTGLYDRRNDQVSLDEVERILI